MSDFVTDVTAAIQPLLTKYGIAHALVTPTPNPLTAFDVYPVNLPPPPPVAQPAFQLGFNIGGTWPTNSAITDSAYDIGKMTTDISAMTTDRIVRVWQTGPITGAPAASQFTQTKLLAAAGYKVIAVWNTQNNNRVAPTDFGKAYFTGLPSSAETGIWAIELVNEHDDTDYFNDTPQHFASVLTTSGPILHAKGYYVIGSNALSSLGMYSNSTVKNVLKGNVDAIGRHGYAPNAATALANMQKVKAVADSLGLDFVCTEVGLKQANYVTELPLLWAGCKTMGGTYVAFTLYQIANGQPTINEYACWPYTAQGVSNANLAAIQKGLV